MCLDHKVRDGLDGFITITGGKMMTYRMMAEVATDLACKKLGINVACTTADMPLPGSELKPEISHGELFSSSFNAAHGRHGTMADAIKYGDKEDDALVCECEEVSVGEVKYAAEKLHVHNLMNLRRRTRVGMGTCQGELCTCRAANIICTNNVTTSEEGLKDFLNERWKGVRPVAWGQALGEAQLTATIYQALCGLDKINTKQQDTQNNEK